MPERIVVPVLGMHRSGTSLTTGLLNALGVSLSEDLMPPTGENAMGYFESQEITGLQDRMLQILGNSWHASGTLNPLPPQWWRLPAVAPFKQRLKEIVADEVRRVPGMWGFKDPRTCRLMPLWHEIFAELNLEPRYVLTGRHPIDVAKSLQTRDGLPLPYGELLWLEHTTEATAQIKGKPCAIVEYGRWFDDPMEQAEYMVSALGFAHPGKAALQEAVDRMVSKELRHHASATDNFALPYSRDVYQAIVRRERPTLEMLSDLFAVSSAFAHRVCSFVQPRPMT
jgi:hypothetical protein